MLIRCMDNSLYTGITNNLERRMREHQEKGFKCAKYTKNHTFQKLECVFASFNIMLDNSGLKLPPCGVPILVGCTTPFIITPLTRC